MVEELAGCFIKIAKSSKLPVTRYFLLDVRNECVRYFENSIQLRRVLSKNLAWDQVMRIIDTPKTLDLKNFRLGPQTVNSFSVYIGKQELTFFPWDKESVDKLYKKFLEIKDMQKEARMKICSPDTDMSIEKSETSTLENGNIYCGELNDEGLPHGNNGREFCEDGSIFYGSFRNGKWHGTGCIINSNLDMVQKEYINGEMCGI
jgi:hypothetical protein